MNKIIGCIFMLVFALRAFALDYGIDQTLELKKDEVFIGAIQDTSAQAPSKKLALYWTLYENKGLVVTMRFNNFPHQFILYADYSRNTYNIAVSQESFAHNSHLSVVFKDFKDNKATLRLLASKNLSLETAQ
ncbi:hypothetical protein [Helicobacter cetorum]|uniref:hypothetical protein n=1 Tax=Helicobacter cetorum TaxID=138563 RepID=UPI000CF06B35|nr:hypothetical protein [Helicobacter cetorum]